MKKLFLAFVLAVLAVASTARAQWQSTNYTLHGGWNAIYLHGDASYATPAQLFADDPEVLEVWRWNPNPAETQFESSPLVPSAGTSDWSVWKRSAASGNTLAAMVGQAAYLIRCSGTVNDTHAVTLKQRTVPPQVTWVRNGANLLGFPSRLNGTYPFFSAYFATFPAAIAANTRIYKYIGGELGNDNPAQVFTPTTERLDRNQAYWFESPVVGTFYAPIELSPSHADGLAYGRAGSVITLRVRNRTASISTITITPLASVSAPAGQPQIPADVPITHREYEADGHLTEARINEAFNVIVGPGATVSLEFGIDRAAMTGAPGAFYTSHLRVTDSAGLCDVLLPATALVPTLAGLWVGDIAVNEVDSTAPGSPGSTTSRAAPLRTLLHVDDAGNARLLSQVFLGRLAPAPNDLGLVTRESGLLASARASATRLVAAHLPLDTEILNGGPDDTGSVGLGSTLVRTITIPFNDRTNPFVHAYHPDHDNKDARGNPLPAGVESPTIVRKCTFEFTATPPAGVSSVGWGTSVLGGKYTEVITGLHKLPLTVRGTFQLRRVSEIGAITVN